MAANTNPQLQTQIIYSIYVRNHTPEGTFRAVIPDLDRIRALGTDIIWFLPIHPIGVSGKKGTLGCPYANRDYRSVNPAYGTMDDFKALVREIHARGMKCMIDVVYNHTSPDSTLYHEHPDFFYHGADGKPGNKMGDWSDVIDLDYHNPDLWAYQIESLKFWAGIVDGFRCDVASFVPLAFWKAARKAVSEVNPDCIWLAETVHQSFGCLARAHSVPSELDYDMYEAFDMEYEYDIREAFDKYLQGSIALSHYLDMLNFQEAIYPANYNKLRFLENHDQPRICSFVTDEQALRNYTAMLYFLIKERKRLHFMMTFSLALLLSGAIGNLIDRVALGYVRDMIYVALIDFAVFNVADMAVTVGCCLLVLDLLFFKGKKYMEMMDKKPQTGENS